MTDFNDMLSPESVVLGLDAPNKKALFREIVRHAAAVSGCEPSSIEKPLAAREKLGSTGFGRGIAIPHAQLDCIDRSHGFFFRLAKAIEFGSIDALPVDCVFALFSPIDRGVEHLKALARVSRSFRDGAFTAKLRGARSQEALYALFTNLQTADTG